MKTPRLILLLNFAAVTAAAAQVSTSATYTLLHGEPGESGGAVQNVSGTVKAELGTGAAVAGGVSDVTGNGVQSKVNFTGQLYDPVSLDLVASPSSVNETDTSQLSANAVMDDESLLALSSNDVGWDVEKGFMASIDAVGLLTAGNVYADEAGQVFGMWSGVAGFATITILNTGDDDFGSYAGDGLDDAWQVGFFGLDNPDAAPGKDPDGDEQDNLFENLAGVDPTDGDSFFDLNIEHVAGQPTHRKVTFSPFFVDRTYTLRSSIALDAISFDDEPDTTAGNTGDGGEGTLTDTDAGDLRKFYKVEISRP